MAAHTRRIVFDCAWPRCTRLFTDQVYNRVNAPMGKYCRRHAQEALANFVKEYPDQG